MLRAMTIRNTSGHPVATSGRAAGGAQLKRVRFSLLSLRPNALRNHQCDKFAGRVERRGDVAHLAVDTVGCCDLRAQ
jgi:hypothetical protein